MEYFLVWINVRT